MPKSAKNGTVVFAGNPPADVTNITVLKSPNLKPYASSSTGGKISRRAGHSDESGTFTLKNDVLGFNEGDTGALVLTSDGAVELFSGQAIIGDISFSVPIEPGDFVEATVNWAQKPA